MSTDDSPEPTLSELARIHLASQNGGHWWHYFEGADPPDYYHEPEIHRREDIPEEHLPDLPSNIDWSKYWSYNCRRKTCQDLCLNRVDSRYARYKLCRACYAKVDLDEYDPLTHQLPRWVKRGSDADHTTATSEDRSGRPPAMGAGARTEAHPPNPAGEGESSRRAHRPTSDEPAQPDTQD